MSARMRGALLRHSLLFVLYALIGILLAGIAGFIWLGVRGKPELQAWHTAHLQEEFTEASADRVRTLADYQALEGRLFAELSQKVYVPKGSAEWQELSRYSTGSASDASAYPENFNHTFELSAEGARAGAIFVHGLTDSPYMCRALATRLHERGFSVVALRLPGHGTAPAALVTTSWRDWAAALRMAVKDLRQRLPKDAPLYLVGFSTGAALSVEYS